MSLGAAAFVATGGYAAALTMLHTDVGWLLALVVAALVSAALGAALAVPLLRLRGDYFSVGTLAAAIAVQALLQNWEWAGGASGITLPVAELPFGLPLFQVAVVVAALATALALFVKQSRFELQPPLPWTAAGESSADGGRSSRSTECAPARIPARPGAGQRRRHSRVRRSNNARSDMERLRSRGQEEKAR